MTKEQYIECIVKMLEHMDVNKVKKIFEYVHSKFTRV